MDLIPMNSDKKIVLVVDDNPILLRTVKEMLDEYYTVNIAVSSSQAYSSIEKWRPDIILLDYEMPYANGVEVLKKLRSGYETKDIPVVFFTGSADRDVVTKLVGLKPDGYLLKPPNKKKMIQFIEKILSPEPEEAEEADINGETEE